MTEDPVSSRSGARRAGAWRHLLAAALFLAAALWALRVVLPAPATVFPVSKTLPRDWQAIGRADQKLSAANITWNARRFFTAPWRLYEPGQCFPARHAAALGPHQLGEGLVGVLPYALTRDPIVTYNAVAVASLWLPALTMYALVYHLTGSIAGGIVAGLVFALHPARITDVIHPDVHGNQWAPLTLLFLHRLFTTGRWWDAVGLLASLVLQVLGSLYQLLAFVLLGGVYGAFMVARQRKRLPAVVPHLAVVAIGATLAAWLVFAPYLHMRDVWHVASGRQTLLFNVNDFAPGGAAYPGSTLAVLALVGIAHRRRGRSARSATEATAVGARDAFDGRVALVVATALLVWASVWAVPVPPLGIAVPSLFTLAGRVLPGLDAIRAGAVIGFGVVLTGAVLAGYGVAALTAGRTPRVRAAIATALVVACLVEVFDDRIALRSFGRSVAMQTYAVRPPDALVELYRTSGDGAVLDVPYDFHMGTFPDMADGAFLSAFHHRPAGACYNSFQLPLHQDIAALAARLGIDDRAAAALRAVGFDTVVANELRRSRMGRIGMMGGQNPPGLTLIGRAAAHSAYRLESTAPVTTNVDVLEPGTVRAPVQAVPPQAPLAFVFRNAAPATFRHPDPIEPSLVRVRWRAAGAVVREEDARILLPVALAGGDELTRTATLPVPPNAGDYEVTLSLGDAPDRVLARAAVHVQGG